MSDEAYDSYYQPYSEDAQLDPKKNEMMDSEKYEEQQKELKRKEADPENQAGKTVRGKKPKSKSSASAFAEENEMD